MEFNQNKTPTEVIKEDAFGGTYFRDIYLGVNGKQYGKSWNKFDDLKNIDPYGWFQWYFRYFLHRKSSDGFRQINRWKKILSRFKGKLVKMIKDSGGKFDDYSISPKVRQMSLCWGYELKKRFVVIFSH